MRRFFLALAIACVLSGSAVAGDVPCGDYAPPDSDETQTTSVNSTSEPSSENFVQAGSTGITMTLLQTILSFMAV